MHVLHWITVLLKEPPPPTPAVTSDTVRASGVQFIQKLNFPSPVMVWSWVLEGLWRTKNFSNILSTDTHFRLLLLKPSICSTLLGEVGPSSFLLKGVNKWTNNIGETKESPVLEYVVQIPGALGGQVRGISHRKPWRLRNSVKDRGCYRQSISRSQSQVPGK